jgi:hypothetical protein
LHVSAGPDEVLCENLACVLEVSVSIYRASAASGVQGNAITSPDAISGTHHVARFSVLLDIRHSLLLLLFEFCALALQFTLRLLQ